MTARNLIKFPYVKLRPKKGCLDGLNLIIGISFGLLAVFCSTSIAQSFPGDNGYERIEKDYFGNLFKKGDTNAPLLAMDWFWNSGTVYECRVSRTGNASDVRDVINWAFQNGHGSQLDQTNFNDLIKSIESLPKPPKTVPPRERWLVVRGIRDNQWFKYIYDRSNVPKEVESLYRITGAYLEWFIPKLGIYPITTNLNIYDFYVARNAPKAVLFATTNILLFDLNENKVKETIPLSLIPLQFGFEFYRAIALSPDAKILVKSLSYNVAGDHYGNGIGICAVDLTTKKVLWKKDPLECNGYVGSHVVIGGDKGQYLFACGAHTIERWDLATGKCLAVLATNQPLIKQVEVSQNGKVFMAGFDDSTQDIPKSYTLWRADEDRPAAHLENFGSARACLLPDGKTLALNVFGNKVIELKDWEHGTTKEVPLRLPYGSGWASQIYWSPKGTLLAARLFGATDEMVLYETTSWKPLGRLPVVPSGFDKAGQFLQLLNGEIYSLHGTALNISAANQVRGGITNWESGRGGF